MKKNLLTILLFLCCMQFSFAADRILSLSDLVPLWENAVDVDATTGVITFVNNYNPVGWTFYTPISKDEYTGLRINFKETVDAGYMELKIYYAGVSDPFITYIPKGFNFPAMIVNFTGDVERIEFQSGNWSSGDDRFPTEAPFPSITLGEVLLIEPVETEKEVFQLSNFNSDHVDSLTGIVTFPFGFWPVAEYEFNPVKANNMYLGMQIDFAEPIAYSNLVLKIKYDGIENDCTVNLTEGSTSVQVDFIADVEKIKFESEYWMGGDGAPEVSPHSIKIAEVYFRKIPPITIPEAGIIAFSSTYPVKFDDNDVTVYTINSIDTDKAYLEPLTGIIPAGEGVLIKGELGNYTFIKETVDLEPVSGNLLVGCPEETTVPNETGTKYYIMSLNAAGDAGSAGFYYYNDEGAGGFTVPAGKAYLPITSAPAGAPAHLALSFNDGSATGLEIETQNADKPVDVYSIDGCMIRSNVLPAEALQGLAKGLYIVGGKKIVLY